MSWKKPPGSWMKINVDGAFNETTETMGAGGIIRDHNGSWQVGFVFNIGKGHPLLAKAWAALIGIQIACDRGYNDVILESDSLELVHLLNSTENSP